MVTQARTNHPHSVEGAALHLACQWWESDTDTYSQKAQVILQTVRSLGKHSLEGRVNEMLFGNEDRVTKL